MLASLFPLAASGSCCLFPFPSFNLSVCFMFSWDIFPPEERAKQVLVVLLAVPSGWCVFLSTGKSCTRIKHKVVLSGIVTPLGNPVKALLVLSQAGLSSGVPLETSGFRLSITELNTSV